MIGRKLTEEDLKPAKLEVNVRSHIINDLKEMEKNTKQPLSELVTTALLMYIATHNDYLGRNRVP